MDNILKEIEEERINDIIRGEIYLLHELICALPRDNSRVFTREDLIRLLINIKDTSDLPMAISACIDTLIEDVTEYKENQYYS